MSRKYKSVLNIFLFIILVCFTGCNEQEDKMSSENKETITSIGFEFTVTPKEEVTEAPEYTPEPIIIATSKPTSTPIPTPTPTPTPIMRNRTVLMDTLPDGSGQPSTVYITSIESLDSGSEVYMMLDSVECFDDLFVYREPVDNWHVLVNWSKQYYYGFRGKLYLTDGTNNMKPKDATYKCALYQVQGDKTKRYSVYGQAVYEEELFVIPFESRILTGDYYLEFICCQSNQEYTTRIYFSVIGDQPPKPIISTGVHVKKATDEKAQITKVEITDSGQDVTFSNVISQVHEDYYRVKKNGSFCLADFGISGTYEYTRELIEEEKLRMSYGSVVYREENEESYVSCQLYYVEFGHFAVEFPKEMEKGNYVYEIVQNLDDNDIQIKIYFTIK